MSSISPIASRSPKKDYRRTRDAMKEQIRQISQDIERLRAEQWDAHDRLIAARAELLNAINQRRALERQRLQINASLNSWKRTTASATS